ncbi:MAG: universal stress protein [Candidatus Obscuribacterales bacterium]|nr:universal stress protein [Candidatus Obscuribacterales bacterium]
MKVVVALDDSPYSRHLLDLVCRRHWAPDTEFKLVHVLEDLKMDEWGGENWNELYQDLDARRHHFAEKLLSDARHKVEQHVPGSIVHYEIRKGRPHFEIVLAAADWDANKILMGAHGRGVCPHNLLGSVARNVSEHAPCTVEVIKVPFKSAEHKETVGTAAKQK